MSLFDSLKGALGGLLSEGDTSALPGMLGQALQNNYPGGLGGLVEKLQTGGLGTQVSSWLGNGTNQGISVQQVESVLGNQHVQEIAASLGIPADKIYDFLTTHLPAAVDQASPNGSIAAPAAPAS